MPLDSGMTSVVGVAFYTCIQRYCSCVNGLQDDEVLFVLTSSPSHEGLGGARYVIDNIFVDITDLLYTFRIVYY